MFASYNEIAELPSQVETLNYLVSFKMRHNRLRRLPLQLWSLETLTSLDLSKYGRGQTAYATSMVI
jgi:Leucine-rich repeat (LRR) protein